MKYNNRLGPGSKPRGGHLAQAGAHIGGGVYSDVMNSQGGI